VVELLLANAADIKSVPLAEVLVSWEPKLIQFFLDHSADPVAGRPFAEAFGARVQTAVWPLIEYKCQHPELATQLQEQLDCALRHFCGEGDLKWVSLLTWAGAFKSEIILACMRIYGNRSGGAFSMRSISGHYFAFYHGHYKIGEDLGTTAATIPACRWTGHKNRGGEN
jgi:hypothetical protein